MHRIRQIVVASLCLAGTLRVAAQTAVAPAAPAAPALLTLSSPLIRTGMDRMNLLWLYPEKLPDFRLKMERPAWGPVTATELENRLRGVEVRLPLEGIWVGYEMQTEGEEPRATLSIQRGF